MRAAYHVARNPELNTRYEAIATLRFSSESGLQQFINSVLRKQPTRWNLFNRASTVGTLGPLVPLIKNCISATFRRCFQAFGNISWPGEIQTWHFAQHSSLELDKTKNGS